MTKRWNLLDSFIILLGVLALLSVYFTFIQPVRFSHLIKREGVGRYAEVKILVPDDLGWMAEVMPVGEEFRNVYGQVDWQILGFEKEKLGSGESVLARAKLLIVEESSGLLRYGKYTLVKGSKIFLINDHYLLEGRVYDYRLLEERMKI